MILEGNANLKGCGTLHLPTASSFETAAQDIREDLNKLNKIDLRKSTIGFEIEGDLSSFAGLPHTHIILAGCTRILGMCCKAVGRECDVKHPHTAPLFCGRQCH